MDYEREDKIALTRALLMLHTCPHCRGALQPMALCSHVWACDTCDESWHVPDVTEGGK